MTTIDDVFRFCLYVASKDQRGSLRPSDFNLLAKTAQTEAIADRIGNLKRLNERLLPQYGYKANRRVFNDLRLVLEGPVTLAAPMGIAEYPEDYLFPDAMFTPSFVNIEMVESDEYAHLKQSVIFPPDADHPVAVFFGSHLLIDPADTQVRFSYIKQPVDPNWDYTMVGATPVYNASATPGETGKVSQDFLGDQMFKLEIARKILKYVGVNLDSEMVSAFAKAEEMTAP